MAEDRRRLLIRVIASQAAQASLPVAVRRSTGANCAMCLEVIAPGTREYEIGVGRSTVIVDEKCYKRYLHDIIRAEPAIGDSDG